jgi:hypothetical protein
MALNKKSPANSYMRVAIDLLFSPGFSAVLATALHKKSEFFSRLCRIPCGKPPADRSPPRCPRLCLQCPNIQEQPDHSMPHSVSQRHTAWGYGKPKPFQHDLCAQLASSRTFQIRPHATDHVLGLRFLSKDIGYRKGMASHRLPH